MAFINIKDWKSPNLNVYTMETAKDIQANAVRLNWLGSLNAEQVGSTITEEKWNELQKGIPQFIDSVTYKDNDYVCNLIGLNAPTETGKISIFDGLEIKLYIPTTNSNPNPNVIINSHTIPIKKIGNNGVTQNIEKNELLQGLTFNLIYKSDEKVFICRELSLLQVVALTDLKNNLEDKFSTLKQKLTELINSMQKRLSDVLASSYVDEEHYKKNEIDKKLELKADNSKFENVANKSGDNILDKNTFRTNLEVYSKEETDRKITELAPTPNVATELVNGTISFNKIKSIIDEKIPNATDSIEGKISKNQIKEIISKETPNIQVGDFEDFIRGLSG